MIQWVGESENWPAASEAGAPFLMPLVEETVLEVATMGAPPEARRLSIEAAIACTSRLALRVTLEHTGLNPPWKPFCWEPGVVKAPASCQNLGVRFLPTNEYVARLRQVAPALAGMGVVEQFVAGPAYEMDGFVVEGPGGFEVGFFRPLRQHWNDDNSRILDYEVDEGAARRGIREAALDAVMAAGLRNAPFCAELRETTMGWKLIELHARLGEDAGLGEKMWGRDPLAEIADACARCL